MTEPKKLRGFAAMDPETQRRIASMGGKAVPADQRSFRKDRQLASEAGRRGGQATGARTRSAT